MDFGLVVLAVSAVWIASESLLAIFRRSTPMSRKWKGGSALSLNAVIYASVGLGIWVSFAGVGVMAHGSFFPFCGLVLIVAGLVIRWTAILTLRQYFTVDVALRADHHVVQSGIYRHIRHPSYAGLLLSFLGLGIALNNWITVLVIVIPVTAAFIRRIEIEEKALFDGLGDEYRQYSHTTRRMVPGVY